MIALGSRVLVTRGPFILNLGTVTALDRPRYVCVQVDDSLLVELDYWCLAELPEEPTEEEVAWG